MLGVKLVSSAAAGVQGTNSFPPERHHDILPEGPDDAKPFYLIFLASFADLFCV